MLSIGPCLYDRPGAPVWWVQANGVLVATMSGDRNGFQAVLNLHYAEQDRRRPRFPGKTPTRLRLDQFDSDRLTRWAQANEARLLRECPAPIPLPVPDLSPEAFRLG